LENWNDLLDEFILHLKLEKQLSENTIDAYRRDLNLFEQFVSGNKVQLFDNQHLLNELEAFAVYLSSELQLAPSSLSRSMSGVKSFIRFLQNEGYAVQINLRLWKSPKTPRKLPVYLEFEEIEAMLASIDMSTPAGERDKAMLELLYSSGLRVSELINLKRNDVFEQDHFLKITGKGGKERLVPIGQAALKQVLSYIEHVRVHQKVAKGHEPFVFLNLKGKRISRVSVFKLVKELAEKTGLKKNVSPHSFRHSFATHLVKNGADLRAVQQMLGHASITTTEIYTHLDRAHLKTVIDRFHPAS
jgi:integrase/recombinase XerD